MLCGRIQNILRGQFPLATVHNPIKQSRIIYTYSITCLGPVIFQIRTEHWEQCITPNFLEYLHFVTKLQTI